MKKILTFLFAMAIGYSAQATTLREMNIADPVTGNIAGVNSNRNLLVTDAENGSAIAFGDVAGKSVVQKFGNAPDFDTSDGRITVWDGAEDVEPYSQMLYLYSTTDDIGWISAEDAGDNQLVEVQGLDGSSNLVIQTATLNGQTPVALATNLYRVFRMKNLGSTDFADHVFCHTNGALVGGVPGPTEVKAVVHNGNNQTEMALYTVPKDKEVVIKSVYFASAGAKKSADYEITLWARSPGSVFQLKWKAAISDDVSPSFRQPYVTGLYFDEGTDIECRVQILTAATTEATVSAGFEIEMKDK